MLVTVTNTATNVANGTQSNDSGVYNFPFLPAGNYKLTAEAQGFKFDRHAARNELQAATFGKRRPVTARLVLSPTGAMAIEVKPA